MNKSKLTKNIYISFGGQLIIIILGLIIPRLFISNYGSDINGLLSTITQIYTYMALLEAGIGQAARNQLFKPFKENDRNEINYIISIARNYYRRFTYIYAFFVILLSALLPVIIKTSIDYSTVFLIVLLEGMSGVISFYFIETQTVVLFVDGRNYVNNTINLINKIISYIVKILMMFCGANIIFIQLSYFIISIAKVIVYELYFKKNYPWIKYKNVDRKSKLKDRNSYIVTEIATTIFNSTDMIIISIFLNTQLASVYSVYNMIYVNITALLNSVYFSVIYILGNLYHTSIKKYETAHDAFTTIFLGGITICMSICIILTIPIVKLYTVGITDVNYIYTQLPLLFSLIQILSWSRYVSGNLTGIAGYAKQTSYISLLEAILNLTLSILFVYKYGIVGVLFATLISLPLKVIWCIYIADKKIMNRSFKKTLSIIGINLFVFILAVIFSNIISIRIDSYLSFLLCSISLVFIFGIIGIMLNLVVNKECYYILKNKFKKKEACK